MKQIDDKQELSNDEIKELIKKHKLTQRKLAKIHRRSLAMVNDAINTPFYPGLRGRIIDNLRKRENAVEVK